MRFDPRIECICDGCGDSIDVNPEYKYHNMSPRSGFYDCSGQAVIKLLESEGWSCQNNKHFCESCSEE